MSKDLDCLRNIKKYDQNDMASILEVFALQCHEALTIADRVTLPASYQKKKFSNIVFCGMGGSAIGADLIKDILRHELKIPMFVCRQYTLQSFVDKTSLIVVSSYSGNTEEALSCFKEALKRKATVIVIASGGKLEVLSRKYNLPFLKIHGDYPPRCALGFSFFCGLKVLSRLKLIRNMSKDISETIKILDDLGVLMVPTVKAGHNEPKKIARMLLGKFIVVYSSSELSEAVSKRFKGQLAENSKTFSSINFIPELNHNEIEGWNNPAAMLRNTAVIFLEDQNEDKKIRCRFKATKRTIKSTGCKIITLVATGKSKMAKIFSLIYFCDWVSYYLAIANNVDPYPVKRIEKLKKELARS
jgi:glucose/mannose-6-phosphate isomerase